MNEDRLQLLLTTSDVLRYGNFSGENECFWAELRHEGLTKHLLRFIGRVNREGLQVQVRITSLDYEPIFVFGDKGGGFDQSVSFPIVYVSEGERVPARFSVSIGG